MKRLVPYLLVSLIALGSTVWYTGDLEMAWLAAIIFVPVWAGIVGLVVGSVWVLLTRANRALIAGVLAICVAAHCALLAEEMFVGLIRGRFDAHATVLNAEERARPEHEAELGEGWELVFRTEKDDGFTLRHRDGRSEEIDRGELIALGEQWLRENGYTAGEVELLLTPVIYRKSGLSLRQPGTAYVACDVTSGPRRDGQQVSAVYLHLTYRSGSLRVTATAWGTGY